MMGVKKYITHSVLDWQDCIAYRANALAWGLVDGLPALTMAVVWLSVYRDRTEVGGYSLTQMVTYYMVALAVGMLTTPHPEYDLNDGIRTGRITPYLARPMDMWIQRILGECMWQGVKFLMFLPTLLLAGFLVRRFISLPGIAERLLPLLASLLLAYCVNVGVKMILGSLAFWITETGGIFTVTECIWVFLSGELLPLSLLPPWAVALSGWLPFKWVIWFPVELAMGRLDPAGILHGLVIQFAWALASLGLARVVWNRGLNAFQAVGG